ncbi:MAG: hypothetical protein Ta2G_19180 [Termitinemataceae bacterium]|nr:MAG: hypothetical protein Ta2G_19180 [Termitinemataceae bacterium]
MAIIRSVYIAIYTLLIGIVLLPFIFFFGILNFFGLKRLSARMLYKTIQKPLRFGFFLMGCKVICKGTENIPKKSSEGLCFAANHTSFFDIPLMLATAETQVGFIAKKELGLVPIINIWIWAIGGMYIDRKNARKALSTLERCKKKIKNGLSIAVFPEGTRSKGRGLLPFKSGSFKIVADTGALIIPTAITGCYELFEKTSLIRPSTLYITYGMPLDPKNIPGEQKRHAISDAVRAAIADSLDKQLRNTSF